MAAIFGQFPANFRFSVALSGRLKIVIYEWLVLDIRWFK